MTASYSGDPSTSQMDQVRFLIHDTLTGGAVALLQDEEIDWVLARQLTVYNDPIMAASICADIIAARYAVEVAITADGVSISGAQAQHQYAELAAALRSTYKQLAGVGAVVFVGGIDWWCGYDPTIKPLNFGIGMHDNLRAGEQAYGGRTELEEYVASDIESEDW